jgi:Protein of unknown function (DUF2867)
MKDRSDNTPRACSLTTVEWRDFLAGVSLHDVWAVDLPRARSGITLDEFLRTRGARPCPPPPLVRGLLNIRLFIGGLLGWDREPGATAWESFATRMTIADRSRSLAPAGAHEGLSRVVYRFENEQLLALTNRTAHAAALSAPYRNGKCLPLLFRRLRAQRWSLHADVHDPD